MTFELKPYGKTQRYNGLTVTITEKIDGTNACVVIDQGELVGCQSRNRALDVHNDNMGFANWVEANKEELLKLGDGYHYGEWAGPGIQKNPHKFDQKQFMLFNTYRPADTLPSCVINVPILYVGPYLGKDHVDDVMSTLYSAAINSGYKPEGVIIYFHEHRQSLKYTYANNKSKWSLSNS